ncbi:hypothetical protein G4G28_14085 [Massilia sp. Dwa41.01b]|uniref:hypothetical protein n=1 Tax=unclassified Massilia TaxID=2609279 RepID=UPI0016021866|nr:MULTISPECIES: hypothetical protein [unclassified Massilia]QNA89315.1 hypothetical protein G4G28_14085 [Massilia sp. Dwa41.01b]QNB00214.1 hypothetical protein G4G31_17660 [Massilia sp. Se16.2.3]
MPSKSRMYEFSLRDGHGAPTRVIAAQSKLDAQNIINATKSPLQKIENITYAGWCPVVAKPDEDASAVVFEVGVKGKSYEISRRHESYSHLLKVAAKEVQTVIKYLEED